MAKRRDDDAPKTWFRSERVFRVDGDWFIHTREGIAVGPYQDKFAADVDAEVLKSLLVGTKEAEAVGIIQDFVGGGGKNLASRNVATSCAVEVANLLSDDDDYSFDDIRLLR
jgi:hypothetical protein